MVKLIVANAGEESAKAQAKINCLRREQNKGSQLQGDRLEKLYTSKMIHASLWGEPERAYSNSRIHHYTHVCCSMSMVSKTHCSPANILILTRHK